MLQRGHNGDSGGADCRGEPQHGQLVLPPNPKRPVFGLLKRGEKVSVKVVENCLRGSLILMSIIQGLTLEGL